MTMKKRLALNSVLAGCVTGLTALTAAPALADDLTGDAIVDSRESIIVTATRREEDLQSVPIAITALTSEDIEDAGLTRIEDITFLVPNLTYQETTSNKFTSLVIRGMSQSGGLGNDPNIGVYIDGVYIGRDSGFNAGLMDIERVEVLKGPQGTLFGRNSATGALNIVTRQPSAENSAEVQASFGDYDYRRYGVLLNGVLTDTLFGSLSASQTDRDGFIENTYGGSVNGTDNTFVRGQLLFQPSDGLEFTLAADYSRDDAPRNNYVSAALDEPVDYDPTVSIPDPGYEKVEVSGVSLTSVVDLPGGMTLNSITAFRQIDEDHVNDSDWSPLDLSTQYDVREQSQFSQELRIASPTGGAFEWLAGLYYFHQDFDSRQQLDSGPDTIFAFGAVYVDPTFWSLLGSGLNPTDFGLPVDSGYIIANTGIETTSYAAFASASYHFTDQWTLSGGLRYTRDEKDFTFTQVSDPLSQSFGFPVMDCADPSFGCETSREDEEWTPMVSLQYAPSDAIMLYAKYSRGYNAGGFNANINSGTTPLSFAPETVDAYELGFKSELFDRRLRLNAAVFTMDYENKQESIYSAAAGGFIQDNAGGARSRGAEIEASWLVTDGLEFMGGVGYTDAYYTDYGANTGNTLANAPKWHVSGAIQYTHALSEGFNFVGRLDALHQSSYYLQADNDPFYEYEDRTLVNLRLGVEASDGRWAVTAWARNLFEEEALSQKFGGSSSFVPTYSYSPINPRTFGIDLRYRM